MRSMILAALLCGCNVTPGGSGGSGGWDGSGAYHPTGFSAPDVHGTEAKLAEQDCTSCHGADLKGDDSIQSASCDTCHAAVDEAPEAWRSDCTFCHGGDDNLTGAPPEDIHDAPVDAAFGPHTAHVEGGISAALDCSECHVTPDRALSTGHMFDGSPGIAEVDFTAGLSSAATWSGSNGTCTDSYCHGNGQGDNGTVSADTSALTCTDCHAGQDSSGSDWRKMSGNHFEEHLEDGATCVDCHSGTVGSDSRSITDIARHVNGTADVAPNNSDNQISMAYSAGQKTCTGSCHGERHSAEYWYRD
ncbi:MAG: hypothetical protein ACI8RZ_006374 [Myxococcota bacterium]|jgi:hypothetical protein